MPQYPCLVCGKPSPGSFCPIHQREVNADVRNSRAWRKLSELVRAREPLCRDCKAEGKTRLATQVHHVKPRGQGGSLLPSMEDLVPLCTPHHNKRRDGEGLGLNRAYKKDVKPPANPPLIA